MGPASLKWWKAERWCLQHFALWLHHVSHRYCLQCIGIPDNKAHYFGEKGEIIFHLDFVYHTGRPYNAEWRNDGTAERRKITPNPKTRNGGKSPQILKRGMAENPITRNGGKS